MFKIVGSLLALLFELTVLIGSMFVGVVFALLSLATAFPFLFFLLVLFLL